MLYKIVTSLDKTEVPLLLLVSISVATLLLLLLPGRNLIKLKSWLVKVFRGRVDTLACACTGLLTPKKYNHN